MTPNPSVLLKGFLPYKASKEELEMAKRYLNVNDRINHKFVKESVIKGRRHTSDLTEQQKSKILNETARDGLNIQIPTNSQMRFTKYNRNPNIKLE